MDHVKPWALAATLLVVACTSSGEGPQPASATTAASATASPIVTSTPRPTATARAAAFPELPLVLGTPKGELYFELRDGQPAGDKVDVCSTQIIGLTTFDDLALFFCQTPTPRYEMYMWDGTARKLTDLGASDTSSAIFASANEIVSVGVGRSEPLAPIPMTTLRRRDLRSGARTTVDERYGVAFDLRPTDAGVAVWRPKNSLSFERPDDETGTWMLAGTTLTKLTRHRLVDGRGGQWLLESEAVDPATGYLSSGLCCTYVLRRDGASEQRLTPPSIANEKALAMLDDGRIVAWRVGASEFEGTVVIYQGTTAVREDPVPFTWYHVHRSGDWLVGEVLTTSRLLRAYRASDGAFAETPMTGVSTWGILGARP